MDHRAIYVVLPLAAGAAFATFSCGSNVSTGGSGGTGGTAGTGASHAGTGGTSHTSSVGTGGSSHTSSVGTGGSPAGTGGSPAGTGGAPCTGTGLQCVATMDACTAKGKPATTISGTIYDPAGALPLYNVYVYIPNGTPAAITPGNPTCEACQAPASGSPVIGAITDESGNFTLTQGAGDTWGVPSGDNIPLVIQIGKWRRQVVLPHIDPCTANDLPDPSTPADKLRLPAKSSEGDMPLIAFTSGCDPAECFLRQIGIDDSEFVPPGSPTGHVHFYTGQDMNSLNGPASNITNGNTFTDTYTWWTSAQNLSKYDMVFNACECSQYDRNLAGKGDAYMAMDQYLSGGGRVFATHYYYNWFAPPTGEPDLQSVASWAPETANTFNNYYVDDGFPKGKAFADWLMARGATPTYGEIVLTDTRSDVNAVPATTTRWLYNANNASDAMYAGTVISFNTPYAQPPAAQCGRGLFSDIHLAGTSTDTVFPTECTGLAPSYQVNQQAIEFLFFDLFACVQDDTQQPAPPPPM